MSTLFDTPMGLKEPLADFLNVPIGTTMSVRNILYGIKRYIDNHKLIDRERVWVSPDNCLCDLFGIQSGEPITYDTILQHVFDLIEKRSAAAN